MPDNVAAALGAAAKVAFVDALHVVAAIAAIGALATAFVAGKVLRAAFREPGDQSGDRGSEGSTKQIDTAAA
jgi:hypothetical protein